MTILKDSANTQRHVILNLIQDLLLIDGLRYANPSYTALHFGIVVNISW